jgi:hypothetical protein
VQVSELGDLATYLVRLLPRLLGLPRRLLEGLGRPLGQPALARRSRKSAATTATATMSATTATTSQPVAVPRSASGTTTT